MTVDLPDGAFSVIPQEEYVGSAIVVRCNGCDLWIFEGRYLGDDRSEGLGNLVRLAGAHIGQCPVLSTMDEVKL